MKKIFLSISLFAFMGFAHGAFAVDVQELDEAGLNAPKQLYPAILETLPAPDVFLDFAP